MVNDLNIGIERPKLDHRLMQTAWTARSSRRRGWQHATPEPPLEPTPGQWPLPRPNGHPRVCGSGHVVGRSGPPHECEEAHTRMAAFAHSEWYSRPRRGRPQYRTDHLRSTGDEAKNSDFSG